ncbi:Uncharacterized conserved protein YabE, contains G5 and tandem DUF348 domains [Lentibacillus halodurans]|uniref:Uncharacterized conserved protein YabE, contains G5 and tandem DUF348 domains n=1 Tax=Lentibacillus halodurans TaxID=237679 RepID=A0A1I1A4X2_9BACI|nr:ubiquitin-like domain-containing protein [Lentibacillus halodurans]SFB31540.1 Uncharacterized conserved protein YabE, contains G5 and tandem DUF348 domains [Lentibacillus halodurans]
MKIFTNLLPKSAWQWVLSAVGLLALIVLSGFMIAETTKAEVVMNKNGEEQTIQTHAETVKELLAELEITYSEHDELSHDIDEEIKDGMHITYEAANQITVVIDGEKADHYTTADTIEEFLTEAGISVSEHDDTSHEKDASIEGSMTYTIDKAFEVTINDGGEETDVWTTGGKVADILKANDFSWDDSDKLKPGEEKEVNKDTPITITRVDKVTDEVKETIDYQVEERKDDNLEKGKEKVIAEGQEGVLIKTFEIKKENGEEVSRELIEEEVKQESKKRIVAIGTKEKEQNLQTLSNESNNNDTESEKVLYMNATAYSADCLGCDGSGYTATGINLKENPKVVSVDPNVIPLGTKVWVEGYGNAIAGDTGGHIGGNRIDLHFKSKSEAESFGRKTVKVKVLD